MTGEISDVRSSDQADARRLYLDLLKKAVLATLYEESQWYVLGSRPERGLGRAKRWAKGVVLRLVHAQGLVLVKPLALSAEALTQREKGITSGFFSHTMVGLKRLDNIQQCIEKVLDEGVEGDFIETGAWRGGACIFMRGVLKAYGVSNRTIWVADSFMGFPRASAGGHALDAEVDIDSFNEGGPLSLWLNVPIERVKATFSRYDLYDDSVRFLEGWFSDTLPSAPIERLAILRLDGDLYKSTMDALEALYHKVSPGGFVIVDDYNSWPHCKAAVDEFRATKNIVVPLIEIDQHAVYWRVAATKE